MATTNNSDNPEDEDVFNFESEHLALRGNPCYANLLRTIALLQAQKIRVHQNIEELEKSRNIYLEDPELLLDKLRRNEPLIEDNHITIAELPDLPTLRRKDESGGVESKHKAAPLLSSPISVKEEDNRDPGRSPNFNRFWTNEEQNRLDQLLQKYPPEEVEMRRFTKIAKALGNRTPQQVFSRVQKYFQKLHDAGMPVPGRIPKNRRTGVCKPKFSIRKTTFFPAQNISLHMPEDDVVLDSLRVPSPPTEKPESQIKVEPEAPDMDLEADTKRKHVLRLKLLNAVHEEKQQIEAGYAPDPMAPKCTVCEEAPVTRTHWRCNSCYCHFNLCADCLVSQLIDGSFEHLSHDVVVEQES
ncbi:hypothetical protein KR018_000084 [Drosophila ironensis]|nr:hypothetical protein KR018_000084 [Drosophila ironensis]